MPVYFIAQVKINDPNGYAAYSEKAGGSMKPGMKLLAMDDTPEVVEGDWHGPRTIILEFESKEAFRKWYDSPEYQEAAKLRWAATDSKVAVVDGIG